MNREVSKTIAIWLTGANLIIWSCIGISKLVSIIPNDNLQNITCVVLTIISTLTLFNITYKIWDKIC